MSIVNFALGLHPICNSVCGGIWGCGQKIKCVILTACTGYHNKKNCGLTNFESVPFSWRFPGWVGLDLGIVQGFLKIIFSRGVGIFPSP